MSVEIVRRHNQCKVNIGTSLGNSEAISFECFASGLLFCPSTEATPTVEFYTSETEDGTYTKIFPHNSSTAANVVYSASNQWKELPPSIFGAGWIKMVASAISGGTSIEYTLQLKA